jgi:nicotinate-nucleotide--dimethylbenzimidazole phosphoribosyltransferase
MSSNLNWLDEEPKRLDEEATAAARARQAQLTKPPGALGELEMLAITLAGLQGRVPGIERVHISVFAADHGVADEGVSAFPAAVRP